MRTTQLLEVLEYEDHLPRKRYLPSLVLSLELPYRLVTKPLDSLEVFDAGSYLEHSIPIPLVGTRWILQ